MSIRELNCRYSSLPSSSRRRFMASRREVVLPSSAEGASAGVDGCWVFDCSATSSVDCFVGRGGTARGCIGRSGGFGRSGRFSFCSSRTERTLSFRIRPSTSGLNRIRSFSKTSQQKPVDRCLIQELPRTNSSTRFMANVSQNEARGQSLIGS